MTVCVDGAVNVISCKSSQFSLSFMASLAMILLVSPAMVSAGLVSQWHLVYETIGDPGGELSFPGKILSYDPAIGAVAVEQSIVDNGAAVNGFVQMNAGSFAFTLDRHARINGLVIAPNDVVLNDNGTLTTVIDGSGAGIPDGVKIDALHRTETDQWIISIDVHAELGNTVFSDGDLVGYDGQDFFLVASESDLGLPDSADVAGITHGTGGRWLIALKSGGQTLDGLTYFAGDVLRANAESRLTGIELRSREAPISVTAGLSAISAEPAPDELFSDRFEQ